MHSCIDGWESYVLPKYDLDSSLLTCRLHTGIQLWKKIPNLQDILDNTFEHDLDVDSVLEFVRRDEVNRCFHLYAFCSTRAESERANLFYEKHIDVLLKEISHFNNDKRSGSDSREFFCLPDYIGDETQTNEPPTAKAENLELKNKEFVTLLLAASGCTALEISKRVYRDEKTVENYLKEIRYKTGCKDKKDMNAYVRAKGWQDLIGFLL